MPGKKKAMWKAYFTTKLNIPISRYEEMIEFLKFQIKQIFSAL